nr:hypothetical protein Iba_chr08aCG1810 [Ipomoea batatas]
MATFWPQIMIVLVLAAFVEFTNVVAAGGSPPYLYASPLPPPPYGYKSPPSPAANDGYSPAPAPISLPPSYNGWSPVPSPPGPISAPPYYYELPPSYRNGGVEGVVVEIYNSSDGEERVMVVEVVEEVTYSNMVEEEKETVVGETCNSNGVEVMVMEGVVICSSMVGVEIF